MGIMTAAFSFGAFVSSFIIGHLSDHYGRKPLLLLGVVSCAALLATFGLSPNVYVATANRFLEGVLTANLPGAWATGRHCVVRLCTAVWHFSHSFVLSFFLSKDWA